MLTFLFWPKIHKGQSLTISELIKYRSLDNDDLNDILVTKGWEFVKNENDRNTWAFSKNDDLADAWLNKDKNWENRVFINYNFCNTKNISILKSQLTALGFKKINSETYSSTITSEYTNSNFMIIITYSAREDDDHCDSYTIHLEKRKSIQERQREEKEIEEARLAEIKNQKNCEISIVKRNNRNAYFTSKVDSCNNSIDSILNINYQNLMSLKNSNFEQYEKDSIEAATKADSIAAAEAAANMDLDMLIFKNLIKYGISKELVLIYEYPDELSKAKSGLYKNERIEIIDTLEEYYKIQYDYCIDYLWDDSGYVRKNDLILENKNQAAKPKIK
jgi:hypothetical protein